MWIACLLALPVLAAELRPGVWGARTAADLPLPVSGYQAYLVGELHGAKRNAPFQLDYLERLHAGAGVRDVAIEEDAVYGPAAQRFVNGEIDHLPHELCLRAGILSGIREFNTRLAPADRVRVHLVDVDSPADAILLHLTNLRQEWKADPVMLPPVNQIRQRGLAAVSALKPYARSDEGRAALRTIELSIQALQDGLEVSTNAPKGSPYLESREEAVAANLAAVITRHSKVLAFYGSDHVSRSIRRDGGPQRNQPLKPVALRLQERAIKVYSLLTVPLQAEIQWRGRKTQMPWTAADGSLSTGETFDKLLASAPGLEFLFIDKQREWPQMVTSDLTAFDVDGYLLFRASGPMPDSCR